MEQSTPDKSITGKFKWAIFLTSVTLVAEILGGIWTNSLALLSDAAHVFLDLFALILSLVAIRLSVLAPTETRTYGWHRIEIFASFINGLTIILIAIGILYEAWDRLFHPVAVNSLPMFVIAAVGLVMNILAALALHSHSKNDLNVHSAFLHVIGDAAASVGVIIGGVIMYFYKLYVLDAVISIGIGCIIFWGAWRILRESVHILLEGVPRGLNMATLVDSMRQVEGVKDIHQLNVWAICSHVIALSAHVEITDQSKKRQAAIIHDLEHLLREKYFITHTTLQAECFDCSTVPVLKELNHTLNHDHHGH